MPDPTAESVTNPYTNFRFEVVLNLDDPPSSIDNPLCNAAFAEVSGLEMSMEVKTFTQGGHNLTQKHLPGATTYGTVTLKRGMTSNMHLWAWFQYAAQPGHKPTAQGQIKMLNTDGSEAMTYKLEDCLPVRMRGPSLNAKQAEIAIEELQLVCARISIDGLDDGGGGGIGISAGVSAGISVSGGEGLSADVSASASASFKFG